MAKFYTNKIVKIREYIEATRCDGESESALPSQPITHRLTAFRPINLDELKQIISGMKSNTSRADPIETSVVKQNLDTLAPILLKIINSCLVQSIFPSQLKKAIITPVIKDETKSHDDFKNYRPISNLEFLSKLLEKVVLKQLTKYLDEFSLYTKFQSAYRPNHSCETAMAYIVDDIQQFLENKQNAALIMLDLSSAFDTVDHQMLIDRLERDFGICDEALELIRSYLYERTFSVSIDDKASSSHELSYGVPQGSILGPVFYSMYTKRIEEIVQHHGFKVHIYADDCTVYFPFEDNDEQTAKIQLSECISDIQKWMRNSYLKLNAEKTSLMVFRPDKCIKTKTFSLVSECNEIFGVETSKLLGVMLGTSLNFTEFTNKKIQTCNFHLRNLKAVKNSMPQSTRILLVTSSICSTLDYCNSLLISSPKYLTDRLQKILNNAVRYIFDVRKRDHISPYLCKLHILPVIYRIKFKVSSIAFKVTRGTAPEYLDKVKMFIPPSDRPLRDGCGRDKWMFESTLEIQKSSAFIPKMITTWNALPWELRQLEHLDAFKSQLKTFYFKQAFGKLL